MGHTARTGWSVIRRQPFSASLMNLNATASVVVLVPIPFVLYVLKRTVGDRRR